jgi:hypothetical protein
MKAAAIFSSQPDHAAKVGSMVMLVKVLLLHYKVLVVV